MTESQAHLAQPTALPTALPEHCKAVVFSSAAHRFALPLNAISRIIHRSLLQNDRKIPDLSYFENQPVNQIDLSQWLPPAPPAVSLDRDAPQEPQFFVLFQTPEQQLGLAADYPPVLMNLSLVNVHDVPSTYQTKLQGLARHMVSMGQDSPQMETIFLLDLQQVVHLSQQRSVIAPSLTRA